MKITIWNIKQVAALRELLLNLCHCLMNSDGAAVALPIRKLPDFIASRQAYKPCATVIRYGSTIGHPW